MRDENQMHAAVVEIVAHKGAEVKYSTIQNWYPGNLEGKGGVYNFVTKRGICAGDHAKDFLDPTRNWQFDHLEIPQRNSERRSLSG